jgi:hypothetical protein
MDRMRSYMMLIVFFVLWYIPVVNNIFWGIIVVIVHFLGVPVDLIDLGQKQFLFWR